MQRLQAFVRRTNSLTITIHKSDAPSKSSCKELILTKLVDTLKQNFREKAELNGRLKYLNVSLLSPEGR